MLLYYCSECESYFLEEDVVKPDNDARDAGFTECCKECGGNVGIALDNF